MLLGLDLPWLSLADKSIWGPALFAVTVMPFFTDGIELMMSPRIPSLLSFSMIWFRSNLARFGSLATAVLIISKNLCFSRCSLTRCLTYSICAPDRF